ncbi:MAG: hypothetical protein VZR54_04335 [Ruminococcus sp.]|nr:hypothetical protein [Ruminococcus sp.]
MEEIFFAGFLRHRRKNGSRNQDVVFEECETIVSVTIPDTVEDISVYTNEYAVTPFYNCPNLKTVKLGKSVDFLTLFLPAIPLKMFTTRAAVVIGIRFIAVTILTIAYLRQIFIPRRRIQQNPKQLRQQLSPLRQSQQHPRLQTHRLPQRPLKAKPQLSRP